MTLLVEVRSRNFDILTPILSNEDPRIPKVVSYSHRAIGGPYRAQLMVEADKQTLMNYLGNLRCPVYIHDELGNIVWWGYISDVQLKVGSVNVGISLDNMYNDIRVKYSLVTQGELSKANDKWTLGHMDMPSYYEYGWKSLCEQMDEASTEQAEALRDTLLAQKRYPVPTVGLGDTAAVDGATIYCRGWWDTLSWKYYENTTYGRVGYTEGGGGKATIGDVADSEYVVQKFVGPPAHPFWAQNIKVKACKSGTPTSSLEIEILAADKNTVLWSGHIDEPNVPGENAMDWVEFVVPYLTLNILVATTYYIKLFYTGHPDAVNYYWCALDTGYAPPTGFEEWNGAGYATRLKDADGRMLYQVSDSVETTVQIYNALYSKGGFQFNTGCDRRIAYSNIYSCQYRDNTKKVQDEVEALLKTGTTNNLRLLAYIDKDRFVHILEEPTELEYIYHKDGTLSNMSGVPVRAHMCPTGCWVSIEEVVDWSAEFMANPSRVFVEECSYTVASDSIAITLRDQVNPLDAFTLNHIGT